MMPRDVMEEPSEDRVHPLWLPPVGGGPLQPHLAILDLARESGEEAGRVVEALLSSGQFHQAARCLEVLAQEGLGLETAGRDRLDPEAPEFGAFHATILLLLRSGVLYGRAGRPKTAGAVFRRALIFVEDTLREVPGQPAPGRGGLWSLGVTFELAGHVCVALGEQDGLAYYGAALDYWERAERAHPEDLGTLTGHPVTRTVISCLEPATARLDLDEAWRTLLLTADYPTRLDSARSLLR